MTQAIIITIMIIKIMTIIIIRMVITVTVMITRTTITITIATSIMTIKINGQLFSNCHPCSLHHPRDDKDWVTSPYTHDCHMNAQQPDVIKQMCPRGSCIPIWGIINIYLRILVLIYVTMDRSSPCNLSEIFPTQNTYRVCFSLKLRLHGTRQAARLRRDSRAAKIET